VQIRGCERHLLSGIRQIGDAELRRRFSWITAAGPTCLPAGSSAEVTVYTK
jgi:hypothetical protein